MLAFTIVLSFILLYTVFIVWAERKVAAFVQDRYGPMETGYYGLGQTVADLIKLILKEDIIPTAANRFLFKIAPIIIFTAVFAGFATMPIAPGLIGAGISTGLLYMVAIISLDVIGILIAGWASNNKYSILGAMRSVAQIISYEVPLTLVTLAVVMIAQSLDLQEISQQQGIWINHAVDTNEAKNYLFGIKAIGIEVTNMGGFLTWNVFRMPFLLIGYLVFFIASLAECNRAPFDIPEAESELVGGFHTEYSGFRWAILFLAEYAMMFLVAMLGVVLFFGSWNTALPNVGSFKLAELTSGAPGTIPGYAWGAFWLLSKTFIVIFFQLLVRWVYPRLRVDQLMYLCWKILVPIALVLVLLSSVWRLWMI